jgi:predicted dehydrogenase
MKARLPVALYGVRHVHAPGYAAILGRPPWQLVGFVEEDDAVAANFAHRFGVPRLADALALRRAGARAVVVAGTNAQRMPALQDALQAGLPALAEKPFGLHVEEAQAVAHSYAQAGLPLGVALPMPFSPAVERLLAALGEGELGEVCALVGENVGTYPGDWFGDPAQSGGGCLVDHTVHLADLMARCVGEEPQRVSAMVGDHLETGVERTAVVLLDYTGGRFASLDASWARPPSYPTWGGLSLTVVGSRGWAEVRPFAQRLVQWSSPPTLLDYMEDVNERMLADFARAVEQGSPPRVTAVDGIRALRVQVAAQRSAQSAGRPVDLA